MKIYRLAEKKPDNYQEMLDWFDERTNKHIELVQKYCKKIEDYDERFDGLIERGKVHDQSKFKDPEMEPYIYVSWDYKCKADGVNWKAPEGMNDKMDEATEHHLNNNAHHPEYHSNKKGKINRKDRDAIPDEMIDATKMEDIDVAEMVADWMAVSEERGNSLKSWADKNINIRWKFTDKQKDLIYELIEKK